MERITSGIGHMRASFNSSLIFGANLSWVLDILQERENVV
jgi:hypothetical protein